MLILNAMSTKIDMKNINLWIKLLISHKIKRNCSLQQGNNHGVAGAFVLGVVLLILIGATLGEASYVGMCIRYVN